MNRREEQELVSQMTKYDRKQYFRAKKEKIDKRNAFLTKIAMSVVGVFVILLIAFSVYKSFQPVYTIGTEQLKADEYKFYHTMSTNKFISENYYYLSYFGLDISKPLAGQVFDSETGETWEDFFYTRADGYIQEILSAKIDADKNNYVCEDLDSQIDSFIADIKTAAEEEKVDYNTYLKTMFGNSMTDSKLREYVSKYLYATSYMTDKYDSFEVTKEEILKHYEENKSSYDKVDYLMHVVKPETKENATTAETQAFAETAKTNATTLFEKIEAGEDFVTVINSSIADDNKDKESYKDGSAVTFEGDTKSNIATVVGDWLYDSSRKSGDIVLLENESNGYWYIVKFNARKLDESNTIDVRHILVSFEYDENNKLVAGTDDAAKKKIEEIKALYDENPTVENFEKLANEKSDDTGSNSNGGLYEGVAKGEMVEAFDKWIYDESRKAGDVDIVKTDYGYHLMYYVGTNEPVYYLSIEATLINTLYENWTKDISVDYIVNR